MTLEYLLSPITVEDFIKFYYTQKGVYISGKEKNFTNIFSYKALNKILNLSNSPHPTLKLVKDGRPIIATNSEEIINAVKDGASLIIDQLHKYDECVGYLTKQVSYAMNEPAQVNMYLSQPDVKGFDLHYDTHDVFIIQVEGYKTWKVYSNTIDFPLFEMKQHSRTPPENTYIDVILSPGDVLYIPRGHWHVALATEQASLHLTLGLNSRTGIDFVTWLKEELVEYSLWRQEFPFDGKEEHFLKLKNDLVDLLNNGELFKKFNIFNIANEKKLFNYNFPNQFKIDSSKWSDSTQFEFPKYQKFINIENEDESTYSIYCEGRVFTFRNRAKKVTDFIFNKKIFSLGEIKKSMDDIDETQIIEILKIFLDKNILFEKL